MNYTINEIPDEAVELSGNEMIPIWQGETKKVSVATLASSGIKGYIRDQNILSEWEDFTFTNGSYKAEYDGYMNISHHGTTSHVIINVNDTSSIARFDNTNGLWQNVSFDVKKGDIITLTGSISSDGLCRVRYYKLRDYTGR